MAAARTGSVEAVKALLASGANVNAKETSRGQTALMWAVAQRHPDVVRALIENGADINARSRPSRVVVNRGSPGGTAADRPYVGDDGEGRIHAAAVRGASGRSRFRRSCCWPRERT